MWDCATALAELRPITDEAMLLSALEAFPIADAVNPNVEARLRSANVHRTRARWVAAHLGSLAGAVSRARENLDLPGFVLEASPHLDFLRERRDALVIACEPAVALTHQTPTFEAGLAQTLLPSLRHELDRCKSDMGQYDFDDMLRRVDDALRSPRGPALSRMLRERWRYVVIDEFQDTDETQWSIFRRAFVETRTPRSTVYLVGDPKQSIYRFRGADVQTYVSARDTIAKQGHGPVRLEENFRATPALVDAHNILFDSQAAHSIFTGPIRYSPVSAGQPRRRFVDGDGNAVSPVHVFRFSVGPKETIPLRALGERIAREIRVLVCDRNPYRFDGRPVGYSDVMVLTRTKNEARSMGEALRTGGVPYVFYKEGGLYQSDEAADVRSLLLAVDDPEDVSKRLAAWLGPFFDVPLGDLKLARDVDPSHPLRARLREWHSISERGDLERLFPTIVEQSGIIRRALFFDTGERKLTNILHLFDLLLERARANGESLRELAMALSRLIEDAQEVSEMDADVQRLESERLAVKIMTIHKSKGLEAPVVFLAGGWSKGRPSSVHVYHEGKQRVAWVGSMRGGDDASDSDTVKARVQKEEVEDSQRLMYVAITRAMARVYLPLAVVNDPSNALGTAIGPRVPAMVGGPFATVHARLADVVQAGAAGFTVEDAELPSEAKRSEVLSPDTDWMPPPNLLNGIRDDRPYARLRRHHAAPVMTSYTRLSREKAFRAPPLDLRSDRARLEKSFEEVDTGDATVLRSARVSGIFLHDLLSRVPLASFDAPSFESWRALPEVVALLDEGTEIYRIAREQREHSERLVWSAFTTPVQLPGGVKLDGFARAPRLTREMDFVFAWPGASDPVKGYVGGAIDVAFECDGLTYFLDWKSDLLASYERSALARHVDDHYEHQVRLYTLAVVELLGATTELEYKKRFGGVLYCFLRSMDSVGIWSVQPTWKDVVSWKTDLAMREPTEREP
jgi:exodeoxyribonuclease V beta subunit